MKKKTLLAQKLVKIYKQKRVVNEVTLSLEPGECVGLLGPNGAGKTTTFYIIAGLIKPNSGRVYIEGEDISGLPMYRRAQLGIGYLPQEPSIFRGLSVEDNIRAVLEVKGIYGKEQMERVEELLEEFGILHLRKQKAVLLSGGEKRRVEIARAVACEPLFLLLDEPFTGIDPKTRREVQNIVLYLRDKGIGVLITDHNVRETLEIIDRGYIIFEGRILIEGDAQYLIESPEAREVYLGKEFRL